MNIRQSEVWLVNFFPKVGSETDWKPNYAHYPWMVRVENSEGNGLSKVSAIDCFQVKNFANQRFVKKLGSINDGILKIVHSTVAKALNPAYVLEI